MNAIVVAVITERPELARMPREALERILADFLARLECDLRMNDKEDC